MTTATLDTTAQIKLCTFCAQARVFDMPPETDPVRIANRRQYGPLTKLMGEQPVEEFTCAICEETRTSRPYLCDMHPSRPVLSVGDPCVFAQDVPNCGISRGTVGSVVMLGQPFVSVQVPHRGSTMTRQRKVHPVFTVGQRVRLKTYGDVGTVIEIHQGRYVVRWADGEIDEFGPDGVGMVHPMFVIGHVLPR